jgi:uncharacterized protein (TIGR02328 family)
MRLWSQQILQFLPANQLKGLYREICGMRGKGWGKKHSVVDYVWLNNPYYLYSFHCLVMNEIAKRVNAGQFNYCISLKWYSPKYRGVNCGAYSERQIIEWVNEYHQNYLLKRENSREPIYKYHNENYLNECLENLKNKGVIIDEKRIE